MIKNSCSVRLGSCRMAACPRTVVSRNPVRFVIVRAQDQNSSTPPATPSPTASPSATPAPAAPVREEFLKGQGTAIVTGAISIIVSLAYFVSFSLAQACNCCSFV